MSVPREIQAVAIGSVFRLHNAPVVDGVPTPLTGVRRCFKWFFRTSYGVPAVQFDRTIRFPGNPARRIGPIKVTVSVQYSAWTVTR